jgi:hypothetical protein
MAQALRFSGGAVARNQPEGFAAAQPTAQDDLVQVWQTGGGNFLSWFFVHGVFHSVLGKMPKCLS